MQRPQTALLQKSNYSRVSLHNKSSEKQFIRNREDPFESTNSIEARTQNYVSRKFDNDETAKFLQDKLFAKSYEYHLMQKNTHNKFIALKNENDKPYSYNEDPFLKKMKEQSSKLQLTYSQVNNQQERYYYNLLGRTRQKYGKFWRQKGDKQANSKNFLHQTLFLQIQNENPKLAFIANIGPSKNQHVNKLKEKLNLAIEGAKQTQYLFREKEKSENLMKALKFKQQVFE